MNEPLSGKAVLVTGAACGRIFALACAKADLSDSSQAENVILLVNKPAPQYGLVNSAAIFESLTWKRLPSIVGRDTRELI